MMRVVYKFNSALLFNLNFAVNHRLPRGQNLELLLFISKNDFKLWDFSLTLLNVKNKASQTNKYLFSNSTLCDPRPDASRRLVHSNDRAIFYRPIFASCWFTHCFKPVDSPSSDWVQISRIFDASSVHLRAQSWRRNGSYRHATDSSAHCHFRVLRGNFLLLQPFFFFLLCAIIEKFWYLPQRRNELTKRFVDSIDEIFCLRTSFSGGDFPANFDPKTNERKWEKNVWKKLFRIKISVKTPVSRILLEFISILTLKYDMSLLSRTILPPLSTYSNSPEVSFTL